MTAKKCFAFIGCAAMFFSLAPLSAASFDADFFDRYGDNLTIAAADPVPENSQPPSAEPAMAPAGADAPNEGDTSKFWERWGFSGSARAAYWSSSRHLDDEKNLGAGALWLKWAHKLPQGIGLYAEGWARSDNVFKGTDKKYLMREAYVDYALDSWDFRVGRQIVAWGRADRVNPTDNLTPRTLKN